jgi:NitT/TauT family transport system substrate-binding protein
MESELLAGRVDAASIHEPFATAAVERGSARVLANPWGDVVPKFLIASWFASNKWIQKNKDVVEGFVRAINRGIDAMRADPEETRYVMGKWVGLPTDVAGKVGWPLFEKAIAEKDVQPTIDLTQRYTMITRSFQASQIISELAPRV